MNMSSFLEGVNQERSSYSPIHPFLSSSSSPSSHKNPSNNFRAGDIPLLLDIIEKAEEIENELVSEVCFD